MPKGKKTTLYRVVLEPEPRLYALAARRNAKTLKPDTQKGDEIEEFRRVTGRQMLPIVKLGREVFETRDAAFDAVRRELDRRRTEAEEAIEALDGKLAQVEALEKQHAPF